MNRHLFSRIGLIGKSMYLLILSNAMFIGWSISRFVWSLFEQRHQFQILDILGLVASFFVFFFLPFFLLYGTSWLFFRRQKQRYAPGTLRKLADRFAKCQLALCHMNDEAVEGLRALRHVNLSIFDRRFAIGYLLLIIAAAMPIILYTLTVWSPSISEMVLITLPEWFEHLVVGPAPTGVMVPAPPPTTQYQLYQEKGLALVAFWSLFEAVIPTAWYYFVVVSILIIATPISIVLSAVLSRRLDRLTWHQICRLAFGSDTRGETAIGSQEMPSRSTRRFSPLPDEISCLLAGKANEAAGQSIEKFRDAIRKLAFSLSSETDPHKVVSKYITWNELIHNMYFKTPGFRKLVCYAIAHSPGFFPSEKLKTDPEYEKLGRWLEEVERA